MKTATMILTESFMRESGISAATLARMAGVSPTSLRDALRGESYLGAEREARILETASRVAKFKEALEPLDLPREWNDLAALLESTPEQVRECVGSIFQREGE
jgi:transcriptional regulator with XRE-family HTH domain